MAEGISTENATVVVELLENAISTGHISQNFASTVFESWLVKQQSPDGSSSPVSPSHSLQQESPTLASKELPQSTLPYVGSIRRRKNASDSLINTTKKRLSWSKRFASLCTCGGSLREMSTERTSDPSPMTAFSYPPTDVPTLGRPITLQVVRIPSAPSNMDHLFVRPPPVTGGNHSLPASPQLPVQHVYSIYDQSDSGSTSESLYETTDDYHDLETIANGSGETTSPRKKVKFSISNKYRPLPTPTITIAEKSNENVACSSDIFDSGIETLNNVP